MKYLILLVAILSIHCGKNNQGGVNTDGCNVVNVKVYGNGALSFWGDSITQGQTGGASTFTNAFNILMANALNDTDVNHGYSGSQLTDVCEYNAIMNWPYLNSKHIWLVGFNDATFSGIDPSHLALFQTDMTQAIQHLTSQGNPVFIGTTLNMPSCCVTGLHTNATVQAYIAIETYVVNTLKAQGLPVYLVDTNGAYDADTMAFTDNIHPNDTGHAAIAQAFESAIQGVN